MKMLAAIAFVLALLALIVWSFARSPGSIAPVEAPAPRVPETISPKEAPVKEEPVKEKPAPEKAKIDPALREVEIESLWPDADGSVVLSLKEKGKGGRSIQMKIGASEGVAIATVMAGRKAPRPMTHDLMKNVCEAMGGKLLQVAVVKIEGGVFYGEARVESNGKVLAMDARPSDLVALAVRFKAPIYVAESVFAEAGTWPAGEGEGNNEKIVM